jgi:hypothetical protein
MVKTIHLVACGVNDIIALYFTILTSVDGCPQLFEQWGLGRLAKRAVWAYLIVYAGNAAASLGAPLRGQKGARVFVTLAPSRDRRLLSKTDFDEQRS